MGWLIAIAGIAIVLPSISGFAVTRYLKGARRWIGMATALALSGTPFLYVLTPDFRDLHAHNVDTAYHLASALFLLVGIMLLCCLAGLAAGAFAAFAAGGKTRHED